MQNRQRMKTAILISGSGTTMEAILSAHEKGELDHLQPTVVLSSSFEAKGLEKAKKYDVAREVVDRKSFRSGMAFGEAILEILRKHEIELVTQNGWLPLTPSNVVKAYEGMIINQHPGPLDIGKPDFGGKGMYGERVTAARLAYLWMTQEEWWTEATVHAVNERYDEGVVIEVGKLDIEVHPNGVITAKELQTEHSLSRLRKMTEQVQSELLPIEHQTVIAALKQFAGGKSLKVVQREKPLIKSKKEAVLDTAKKIAVEMFKP